MSGELLSAAHVVTTVGEPHSLDRWEVTVTEPGRCGPRKPRERDTTEGEPPDWRPRVARTAGANVEVREPRERVGCGRRLARGRRVVWTWADGRWVCRHPVLA